MALKSDAKFEEKLTCGLENDMSNLENIYQKYFRNSQDQDFDGILLPRQKMDELKIYRGVTYHDNEE